MSLREFCDDFGHSSFPKPVKGCKPRLRFVAAMSYRLAEGCNLYVEKVKEREEPQPQDVRRPVLVIYLDWRAETGLWVSFGLL
jgi:hypothetical protein